MSHRSKHSRVGACAVWLAVAPWAASLSGCGPNSVTAPELLHPTGRGDAFEGAQCGSFRPPTEPDLMAWDAGSRARLDSLQDQGVVAVRYHAEGCNVELEVLNCVAAGSYAFKPYRANQSKILKSQRDLFAELPIGAARFGGKVGGGRALRTDYMLAGVLTVPVTRTFSRADLAGADCDRATHVVGSIYVGGFAMASGQSETIAAQASIFGVGAGGEQDRSAEGREEEGSPSACKKAQDDKQLAPDCSVPLRVGLIALAGGPTAHPMTQAPGPPPPPAPPSPPASAGDSPAPSAGNKEALLDKMRRGDASANELKMLKAICLSDGDKGCRNSAVAALKSQADAAASDASTAKIVVVVSGGTCDIRIDDSSQGTVASASVTVPAGRHKVACGSHAQSKICEAGKTCMVLFKLTD